MSPAARTRLSEETARASVGEICPSTSRTPCQDGAKPGAQRRYWLASNVFVALAHDSAIFLDLRRDRYFGLNGLSLPSLSEILNDLPAPAGIDTPEQLPLEIVQSLLNDGLIVTSRPDETLHCVIPPHHAGLIAADQGVVSGQNISARDLMNFLAAYIHAKLQLRFQSFETIVRNVAARKRQATRHGPRQPSEKTVALANTFRALRPLAFSADGRCLFHALALVHFLVRYDSFPIWVIGVRSAPFAAHSWVQEGDVILDATPEHIAPYTPILGI